VTAALRVFHRERHDCAHVGERERKALEVTGGSGRPVARPWTKAGNNERNVAATTRDAGYAALLRPRERDDPAAFPLDTAVNRPQRL